jgi:DNA repair ATPase RecN
MNEPDNLVLQWMRRLDQKFDRMAEDVHDIKIRLTNLEENLATLNRRADRGDARLERIERRLDLTEAPQ